MKTFLTLALWFSCSCYASDEKCLALSNLAETIYRNNSSVNELQMLQNMERKAHSIDFAFIKLFSGIAYSGQKFMPNKFKENSYSFCAQLVEASLKTNKIQPPSTFCEPAVRFSNLINAFRASGDSKEKIKKSIADNFSSYDSATRAVSDYLALIVEMRFSPMLEDKSDKEFMAFSSVACVSFSAYLKKI